MNYKKEVLIISETLLDVYKNNLEMLSQLNKLPKKERELYYHLLTGSNEYIKEQLDNIVAYFAEVVE